MQKGWVNFKIEDIYVPPPDHILMKLHGSDVLQGKIIDSCDSGPLRNAFVVVEVEGLEEPLVVPAKCIKGPICE